MVRTERCRFSVGITVTCSISLNMKHTGMFTHTHAHTHNTLKIPFKNKNRVFSFIFLEKKRKRKNFPKHISSEKLSCSHAALRGTAPTAAAPWGLRPLRSARPAHCGPQSAWLPEGLEPTPRCPDTGEHIRGREAPPAATLEACGPSALVRPARPLSRLSEPCPSRPALLHGGCRAGEGGSDAPERGRERRQRVDGKGPRRTAAGPLWLLPLSEAGAVTGMQGWGERSRHGVGAGRGLPRGPLYSGGLLRPVPTRVPRGGG